MKRTYKALLLVLCAVLLVAASVMGTLAYLTSTTEIAKNTFTYGDVKITLDETDVDLYGEKDGDTRVLKNTYKLIPGHTYIKDPVVHVEAKSEQCYVRVLVTLSETDIATLKTVFPTWIAEDGTFLLQNLVGGWDANVWEFAGYKNGTYEFRYHEIVDAREATENVDLPAVFKTVEMPENLTNKQVKDLDGINVDIIAHAMQADGFKDAAEAWSNWS